MDPHEFELYSTLASLAANWVKQRADDKKAANADEFKTWLRDIAFPELIAKSEHTLRTVISLKANQREQFDILLDHVTAIRRAVVGPTERDRWLEELRDLDRQILQVVYERVRNDPHGDIEPSELPDALRAGQQDIHASAKLLKEKELIDYQEYAGGAFITATSKGILLTGMAVDPEFAGVVDRLKGALPKPGVGERFHTLALAAKVPVGLAYFVICGWCDQDLLTFQDTASPWDEGIVDVSETFWRSINKSRSQ